MHLKNMNATYDSFTLHDLHDPWTGILGILFGRSGTQANDMKICRLLIHVREWSTTLPECDQSDDHTYTGLIVCVGRLACRILRVGDRSTFGIHHCESRTCDSCRSIVETSPATKVKSETATATVQMVARSLWRDCGFRSRCIRYRHCGHSLDSRGLVFKAAEFQDGLVFKTETTSETTFSSSREDLGMNIATLGKLAGSLWVIGRQNSMDRESTLGCIAVIFKLKSVEM
jgi:hypothetical protein